MPAEIRPSGDRISVNGVDVMMTTDSLEIVRSWADMTSGRAFDTPYTNDESYDIYVNVIIIQGTANTEGEVSCSVGSIEVARLHIGTSSANETNTLSFVVPSGATYQVSRTLGTSLTIDKWSEFR